jgi:uncharacterized damage-inducible protein DinB
MAQSTSQSNQVERIAEQLRRAFSGDAWHGPAVLELLADVDAKTAASRPIPGAHSIWEIVEHLSAWEEALTHRMGGRATELDPEQDWPAVSDTSAAAWKRALDTLEQRHAALIAAVEALPEYRLLNDVPNREHDFYHMLHGCVQHELYHAGQIALLKKANA